LKRPGESQEKMFFVEKSPRHNSARSRTRFRHKRRDRTTGTKGSSRPQEGMVGTERAPQKNTTIIQHAHKSGEASK